MKKSKHKNTDQDYLHVVEFSQGKPNEISFNVLGKKSSASAGPEKKGFWARFRRKNKGSYEGFGASMALGSGENPALKDALSRDTSSESDVSRETATSAPSGKTRGKHAQPAQKRFGRPSFLMLQGSVPKPMQRSVVVKNNVRAAALSAYCWWF